MQNATPNSALKIVAYVAFIAGAAIAMYSFVSVAREGEMQRKCRTVCLLRPDYAGANRRAPAFSLTDMNGKHVELSQFRGKVVVLNFWTKTCGPCMEEMPNLAELAKILHPRTDIVVLAVSTDEGPDAVRDVLRATLREEPPFTVLFDPEFSTVEGKFGTKLYPETWIIDPRGVIRARFDGAREWNSSLVIEWINQLVDGDYCPVEIGPNRLSGEGASVCTDGS